MDDDDLLPARIGGRRVVRHGLQIRANGREITPKALNMARKRGICFTQADTPFTVMLWKKNVFKPWVLRRQVVLRRRPAVLPAVLLPVRPVLRRRFFRLPFPHFLPRLRLLPSP